VFLERVNDKPPLAHETTAAAAAADIRVHRRPDRLLQYDIVETRRERRTIKFDGFDVRTVYLRTRTRARRLICGS